MSENEKMIRDIYVFLYADMGWDYALHLITEVAKSDWWIDYLLDELISLEDN